MNATSFRLVLLAAPLAAVLSVFSPARADDAPLPPLRCDVPDHDFGQTAAEPPLSHDFVLVNQSSAPLSLPSIRPSRSSISTRLSPSPIPPGQSAILHVDFDPTGYRGPFLATVTIRPDVPGVRPLILVLRAELLPPITVTPPTLRFEALPPANAPLPEFVLTASRPFAIYGVDSSSPHIAATPLDLKSTDRHRIVVALRPSMPPGTTAEETLTIMTDLPSQRRLSIPVSVSLPPAP